MLTFYLPQFLKPEDPEPEGSHVWEKCLGIPATPTGTIAFHNRDGMTLFKVVTATIGCLASEMTLTRVEPAIIALLVQVGRIDEELLTSASRAIGALATHLASDTPHEIVDAVQGAVESVGVEGALELLSGFLDSCPRVYTELLAEMTVAECVSMMGPIASFWTSMLSRGEEAWGSEDFCAQMSDQAEIHATKLDLVTQSMLSLWTTLGAGLYDALYTRELEMELVALLAVDNMVRFT